MFVVLVVWGGYRSGISVAILARIKLACSVNMTELLSVDALRQQVEEAAVEAARLEVAWRGARRRLRRLEVALARAEAPGGAPPKRRRGRGRSSSSSSSSSPDSSAAAAAPAAEPAAAVADAASSAASGASSGPSKTEVVPGAVDEVSVQPAPLALLKHKGGRGKTILPPVPVEGVCWGCWRTWHGKAQGAPHNRLVGLCEKGGRDRLLSPLRAVRDRFSD